MFKRIREKRRRNAALEEADRRVREKEWHFANRTPHVWTVARAVRYAELAGDEPIKDGDVFYGGGTANATEAEIAAHFGNNWRTMVDRDATTDHRYTGGTAPLLWPQVMR